MPATPTKAPVGSPGKPSALQDPKKQSRKKATSAEDRTAHSPAPTGQSSSASGPRGTLSSSGCSSASTPVTPRTERVVDSESCTTGGAPLVSIAPAAALPPSFAAVVEKLASAPAKPGGLLDAMRQRGTLPPVGGVAASPLPRPVVAVSPAVIRSKSAEVLANKDSDACASPLPAKALKSPAKGQTAKAAAAAARKRSRDAWGQDDDVDENERPKGKAARKPSGNKEVSSAPQVQLAAVQVPAAVVPLPILVPDIVNCVQVASPAAAPRPQVQVPIAAAMPAQVQTPLVAAIPTQVPSAGLNDLEPNASSPAPRAARSSLLPPVPSFGAEKPPEPEPWRILREMKLPPPKPEDNYEISDKEDSDAEEPDRSKKHVPEWSKNYLELINAQSSIDPDSIFGCRVPRCDLEEIFRDDDYRKFQSERPQRKRGSSGEWRRDRLSKAEIGEYKRKMGLQAFKLQQPQNRN